MAIRQPRYSKEEFARRGDEAYKQQVEPVIGSEDYGKIVAIDIDTGDWELDEDEMAACDRILTRHPDAQIWIVRAGSPSVRHFGKGRRTVRP